MCRLNRFRSSLSNTLYVLHNNEISLYFWEEINTFRLPIILDFLHRLGNLLLTRMLLLSTHSFPASCEGTRLSHPCGEYSCDPSMWQARIPLERDQSTNPEATYLYVCVSSWIGVVCFCFAEGTVWWSVCVRVDFVLVWFEEVWFIYYEMGQGATSVSVECFFCGVLWLWSCVLVWGWCLSRFNCYELSHGATSVYGECFFCDVLWLWSCVLVWGWCLSRFNCYELSHGATSVYGECFFCDVLWPCCCVFL